MEPITIILLAALAILILWLVGAFDKKKSVQGDW